MFLRRIKAILVNAAVWAVAWAIPGLAFAALLALRLATRDLPIPFLQAFMNLLGPILGLAMGTGFIGGALFATGLMLAEGNRSVNELSRKRAAVLGLIGGVAIPMLLYLRAEFLTYAHIPLLDAFVLLGGAAACGAVSATAALAIAQKGEDRDALPAGSRPALPS